MASDVATMATAPDAAPTETTVETGVLPCPHFEGVEKRVEIDFHDGINARGACQPANQTESADAVWTQRTTVAGSVRKTLPHRENISEGACFAVSRGDPTRADWRIIEPPRRRASAARHPAFDATRLAIPTLTKRRFCLLLPVSLLSQASARCRARFWTTP
jgi:hypothetical protein